MCRDLTAFISLNALGSGRCSNSQSIEQGGVVAEPRGTFLAPAAIARIVRSPTRTLASDAALAVLYHVRTGPQPKRCLNRVLMYVIKDLRLDTVVGLENEAKLRHSGAFLHLHKSHSRRKSRKL